MDKQALRERVWDDLEASGVARFPFPPHGRIPNFDGADEAAERLTARGMGVNVTVNYALPQQIAFAGAIEENSTAKVSFRTQMDGRLDDPVGEQLEEAGVEDWEEVKKWATTAIRQREYHMLNHPPQEGGLGFNKSYPLAASGRGPWNIERGTNNGPVPNFITIFPDKAEDYDSTPREIDPNGIWTELPDGYLDKLMKSSIFRQAYEPDGMMPEEFIAMMELCAVLFGVLGDLIGEFGQQRHLKLLPPVQG